MGRSSDSEIMGRFLILLCVLLCTGLALAASGSASGSGSGSGSASGSASGSGSKKGSWTDSLGKLKPKACAKADMAALKPPNDRCKKKMADFAKKDSDFMKCSMAATKLTLSDCKKSKAETCKCVAASSGFRDLLSSGDCAADGFKDNYEKFLACKDNGSVKEAHAGHSKESTGTWLALGFFV